MKLHEPFIISPRLLPGIQVGNAIISITWAKREGSNGRARYQYYIDTPEFEYESDDLQSGCCGGSLQGGMESLLSFLGAAAEAESYRLRTGRESENGDLFPDNVREWAYQNATEIECASLDLEGGELIEE